MFLVFGRQVTPLHRTGGCGLGVRQGGCHPRDFFQAGVAADWLGIQAGDFEAIILGGVVRRGNLNAATCPEIIDGKVHLGRVDHADVDHVDASGAHAFDQGLGYRPAMRSHVMTDTHRLRITLSLAVLERLRSQELSRGAADFPCILLIDLAGINASYVIRFENGWIHLLISYRW